MLQAAAAERAILSTLIKEPSLYFEIGDVVTEKDFVNSGARVIYKLIRETLLEDKDAHIDAATLLSMSEQKGISNFLELTQNGELVEALEQTSVNPSTLGRHVNALKTISIKRQTLEVLDNLKEDIGDFNGEAVELKNLVEDRIFKTMQSIDKGGDEIVRIDDGFEEVINEFAEVNSLIGIDIGFPRWQKDCGGIRNGSVTGVFARAKTGKSQFAAYCAAEAAVKQGIPTLYLDTELQLRDQQMRLAGILSGISYSRIESGGWKSSKEEVEKIKECFQMVKDAPYFYKNISGRSYRHVIPVIRKFFHKYVGESKGDVPQCLVIYDYVKLMSMDDLKTAQEWQILGFLLSAIHDVAAQLNIPILCLGQLNREALKTDSEYTVAGSDRITHNLDSLTIFRQKKEEEIDSDGEHRGTHIFKTPIARKGPGHEYNDWVNINFDKSSGQFSEDKRNVEVIDSIQKMKPVRDRLEESDISPLGNIRED